MNSDRPVIEADNGRGGSPTRPHEGKKPQRKSPRQPGHFYGTGGAYFVTVCIAERRPLLARIENGTVTLTDSGQIVSDAWQEIPIRYSDFNIDEFIIMPDHVHGILWLNERAGQGPAPTTLPDVMRKFKTWTASRINQLMQSSGQAVWQRSYYDRHLRDEAELSKVRLYIRENPSRYLTQLQR